MDASDEAGGGRPSRRGFLPMPRAEGLALAFLILFAAVAFLPVWGRLEVAGLAVFGWLMAVLMLVSPALMLWLWRRGGRR